MRRLPSRPVPTARRWPRDSWHDPVRDEVGSPCQIGAHRGHLVRHRDTRDRHANVEPVDPAWALDGLDRDGAGEDDRTCVVALEALQPSS